MIRNTLGDFWNYVDVGSPGECWEWKGSISGNGYGYFAFDSSTILAHRMAWMISFGDIPSKICVCHYCDNPICCNPSHLWLGTRADNNVDRAIKGRSGNRPGRKLTARKVDTIRAFYLARIFTGGELARIHEVSRQTINRIVNNKAWVSADPGLDTLD